METLLNHFGVDYDDYHNSLKVSEVGKDVILKRKINEIYVNNYNPAWLLAWQANLDIQFCLDHYSVVTYVADHFTKDDTGLTQVLQKAFSKPKYINDFDRLNYLKQVFFTHRQVCVCEAAYRLIFGLNLKGANIKCFFVPSGFPENRTTFLKRISEEDEEDNDGIVEENDDEGNANHSKSIDDIITMPGREGNYALTQSILQKYESRPSALINICLAQFATIYDVFSGKLSKKTEIVENISKEVSSMVISGTDEHLPKFIKLKDEKSTVMKLRSTPKILR